MSEAVDINWFFYGIEKFKLIVVRSLMIKIISTVSILVFVKNTFDVYIYCFIMTLSVLLNQIILWLYILKYVRVVRIEFSSVYVHIKPNLILFLSVLGTSIYKYMDKIMLGKMANFLELGFYEQAEKIIAVPVALVVSLGTVMLPRMSYLKAKGERSDTFDTFFDNSVIFAVFVSSGIAFLIMGVAREFVPLFYGEGYGKIADIFYVLLPSCIFLGIGNVITTQYLIPTNKDNVYIKSIFLGAIVNVVVNCLLISKYKSIGASIGTFIAELVVCSYKIVKANKETNILKDLQLICCFLVSGLVTFLILYNISLSNIESILARLLVKILMGIAIYFFINTPLLYKLKIRR